MFVTLSSGIRTFKTRESKGGKDAAANKRQQVLFFNDYFSISIRSYAQSFKLPLPAYKNASNRVHPEIPIQLSLFHRTFYNISPPSIIQTGKIEILLVIMLVSETNVVHVLSLVLS